MTNLDELPIDRDIHPVGLCTEDDSGLVAISLSRPRLRWRLAGNRPGSLQLAYEVQRCALGDFSGPVTSTGQVVSHHPVAAQWPGPPLASREVTWLRVRVWTQQGVTRWSDPLRVEASLLEADDWIARPITPPANRNRIDPAPPVLFRRAFTVEPSPVTARLYVTALGVYQFWINGLPLSPDLFEPGWSAYHSRLLFAAHDVTKLLRPGRNALAAMVGDGWWRGTLTWIPRRAVYG
ncbi:MAG: alpha-L-rhamnosidase N-terminal domain-containing protein, partial [Novosphingobium sp.]|nr:alpha-L-rhamnosidase N-terminal domain-containing protein [Novosphingobium sp.]